MFVVLNEHSEVFLQGFKGRRRFQEPDLFSATFWHFINIHPLHGIYFLLLIIRLFLSLNQGFVQNV